MKLLKTLNKKKYIDNKLNFATHLLNITKNANIKVNVLTWVRKCISIEKKHTFFSFIKFQFTHCSLIWVFCIKLVELTAYMKDFSDFKVLLENANEKRVHQKCIELLMIEVYKYLNSLSPDIMSDIFKTRENTYNLRISQNPRTKKLALLTDFCKKGRHQRRYFFANFTKFLKANFL